MTYQSNGDFTVGSSNSAWLTSSACTSIAYAGDYTTTAWPYWSTQPNFDNTYYIYRSYPATTNITYTLGCDPYKDKNEMKITTKELDDKFMLIAELAGFKKEEVKVKYFAPDTKDKPYILITAESETHVLKEKSQDSYTYEYKKYLDNVKKVDFATAKTSFDNGLLVITVDYDEASKIKELPIA